MMLFGVNQLLCCLIFALGAYGRASNADWEKKFVLEESWDSQKFLTLNGDLPLEGESNNDLVALREQPVKETRVKRETPTGSGSGNESSDESGVTNICREKLDLGFILDRSGSIGSANFEKIKSFVKDLTGHFEVSQEYTRVSVMSYASSSTIHFPFSQQFPTKQDLHSAINNISYTGGNTYTGQALTKAYTTMFDANNGARLSDARQVLIVLTDGQSSGNVDQPAQQLKSIGVIIFSIGLGSGIDVSELQTMASPPAADHVYLLDNFNELSTLAEKMSSTTCNATSFLVLCSRDNITVVIGRHALSSVDIDNMYLADGACKASYNATHAYVTTALNRCGTMYSETDQEMYYNNTLTAAIPISPGSVITRKQSLAFTFKCTYSRLVSVSGFKFEAPKPVITVQQSDIGNFTVNMDSFKDAGFISSSSEDYPAFKSFEDRINIQYGVSTSNTDIVVRAETCRATPSSKPYDTPQYEFISEACDKDPTITHHSSGLQQYHQFSIQAFRFLVDHQFVYIHCDLRLCNKNIQDSVCTRSTTCSSRKRRDASPLETTERTFQLSIGPIMYREKTKGQNVKTDQGQEEVAESSPNTIMIVILICVGLIVVLLAVAVVFLVKRRGASQPTTSLEVIPMEYPADKMLAFGNGYVAEK